MKSRKEIKGIAKDAFYRQYWLCVGANVIVMALCSVLSGISLGVAAFILVPSLVIGLNFFSVAMYRGEPSSIEDIFREGFDNFGRKLGGYLWMELFIYLWSLLFVIPGIIKAISYALTPYILADCKNVRATDALKLSMRMMEGHKWEYFVLGLSFIGWMLLTSLTCGLLYVFYVGPYMNNTFAGYYAERKAAALAEGTVTQAQLAGEAL
ncbi:MAG: DUF975 family protein [Christensenellales bacterium]|nr:DUF975 family protein [Clostridium sp.]MDD7140035.1 DUF975 family protein [Clostridium sp.]MDY6080632.1 DUF975 family protein [Eubacteriales bacterium]CCX42690.1 uncharacterized protein BN454_00215 [Clostridium sp. CAG:1024]